MTACRVKICGITREEDALLAAQLGASFLGFNFWPQSKRYCSPERARVIRNALPPSVQTVGVFVNADRSELLRTCEEVKLDFLQLHGDETPEDCLDLPKPVIKALRVDSQFASEDLDRWPVSALLFDAPTPGYGGGGMAFAWELLKGLRLKVPLWLAGGISAQNAGAAIRRLRPHVVDVASGAESAPGIKDKKRMSELMAAVKEANFGNAA